jgi:hypothetical protein
MFSSDREGGMWAMLYAVTLPFALIGLFALIQGYRPDTYQLPMFLFIPLGMFIGGVYRLGRNFPVQGRIEADVRKNLKRWYAIAKKWMDAHPE